MTDSKEFFMEIQIDKKMFNEIYIPYLFDYSHRYEVHKGSAASGKSYFITQKLLIKALNNKRKILIMRKIGNTLKDSVWQLFIDMLHTFKIYDKCVVNKSEMKIKLPNESILLFKGLDDPERIKSITGITDIFLEECTEFSLDEVTQLDLRLRTKVQDLQMYFALNPVSKENYCYTYFRFDEHEENEVIQKREYDKTIVFNTTYKNNKFLTQEYIDSLEAIKETNPYYYTVYVEGRFANLGKLVYPNFEIQEFDYKEILKQEDCMAIYGLDFGYVNDPSSLVFAIADQKNNRLYIYDEVYQKGLLNNEIAGIIIQKGISKEIIIADSAEKKSIEEIRRFNVSRIKPCRKGKGSILQGVQKIQQYKLIIHPSCVNAITEVRNYTWKKNKSTGEYINEPIDTYNHLLDALRYSIQAIKKKAKILNAKL